MSLVRTFPSQIWFVVGNNLIYLIVRMKYKYLQILTFLSGTNIKLLALLFAISFSPWAFSQPTKFQFNKCNISVIFSGAPMDITDNFKAVNKDNELGVDSFAVYSEVVFGKISQERAYCICPATLKAVGLRAEINKKSRWNKEIDKVGMALFSPVLDDNNCKDCKLTQTISPKSVPNCFLMQEVISEENTFKLNEQAQSFFRTPSLVSFLGAEENKNSVKELSLEARLVQLKNFRDKNLITQDQYNSEVEKILSGR